MAESPHSHSLSTPAELAEAAIRTLLAERAAGATLCPSEAARLISGSEGDWRMGMDPVHEAVDEMLRKGMIALSWKGKPLPTRAGPYRIGRSE